MASIISKKAFTHGGRTWELQEADNGVIVVGLRSRDGKQARARALLRRDGYGNAYYTAGSIPAAALAAALAAAA